MKEKNHFVSVSLTSNYAISRSGAVKQ